MEKKYNISVLIPFLNEQEGLANLLHELETFFGHNSHFDTEVVMINDGSTDNSLGILSEYNPSNFELKIINLSKNYGSHAALRAGIAVAKGDFITFVYADLQDPLELIRDFIAEIEQKRLDIVWGTRRATGTSGFEKLFSRFYASLMQTFVSPRFPANGFDVVMFNRKIANVLNAHVEANSSLFLQILTLGFKQGFIEYDKRERRTGKSKWTLSKKIKLVIDSFLAFSYAPIRFVSFMGIAFSLVGLLWTLYIIGRKILLDDLITGWPMLASILLMGFGITNVGLGVIAEYLWRTLDASRRRPVYIVDNVIDAARSKAN